MVHAYCRSPYTIPKMLQTRNLRYARNPIALVLPTNSECLRLAYMRWHDISFADHRKCGQFRIIVSKSSLVPTPFIAYFFPVISSLLSSGSPSLLLLSGFCHSFLQVVFLRSFLSFTLLKCSCSLPPRPLN